MDTLCYRGSFHQKNCEEKFIIYLLQLISGNTEAIQADKRKRDGWMVHSLISSEGQRCRAWMVLDGGSKGENRCCVA